MITNHIRDICARQGWSLAEAAQQANLKLDTLYRYMANTRVPPMQEAMRIAAAWGVRISDIWSDDDDVWLGRGGV